MATETSNPEYRKQSGSANQLPQGAAKQLNDASELIPDEDPMALAGLEDTEPETDLTDYDEILFSATDHPQEPITTGASFGPGANTLRGGPQSDSEFLTRAVAKIAASPSASPRVKSFAARVARGE